GVRLEHPVQAEALVVVRVVSLDDVGQHRARALGEDVRAGQRVAGVRPTLRLGAVQDVVDDPDRLRRQGLLVLAGLAAAVARGAGHRLGLAALGIDADELAILIAGQGRPHRAASELGGAGDRRHPVLWRRAASTTRVISRRECCHLLLLLWLRAYRRRWGTWANGTLGSGSGSGRLAHGRPGLTHQAGATTLRLRRGGGGQHVLESCVHLAGGDVGRYALLAAADVLLEHLGLEDGGVVHELALLDAAQLL